jgi:hypothetical protein
MPLPFCYLGIPIDSQKLKNGEWKSVEDRFKKKFSCWASKMFSYGDRLVLINSLLTSFPMFKIYFLENPIGEKRLDVCRSCFFSQSDGHKRKID